VFESFILYWLARDYFALPDPAPQATVFLKLVVSGNMTIYLTRNKGWFWERPLPSWKLVILCETTQLLGTLIVVYRIAISPIGWWLALFVWGYTIVSFFVANAVKIAAYRLIGHVVASHARHLARIEGQIAA
jgi:H+-transporting ATPase